MNNIFLERVTNDKHCVINGINYGELVNYDCYVMVFEKEDNNLDRFGKVKKRKVKYLVNRDNWSQVMKVIPK